MPTERRMKLSDVEARTDYLLPRVSAAFAKACPTVKSLRAEIESGGAFWGEHSTSSVYTENSFVPLTNCRNPQCYGDGLDLERLLRWSVVEARHATYEDTIPCCGYEGSPEGRRRTGSCDARFRVKITVEYNDQIGGTESLIT